MNPLLAAALCLGGIALLTWSALFRFGRQPWARDWVHESELNLSTTMMFWPGLGACLLGIGTALLADGTWWAGLITLVFMPVGVILLVWGGLRLRVPVWFLPAWSRASIRRRREADSKRTMR